MIPTASTDWLLYPPLHHSFVHLSLPLTPLPQQLPSLLSLLVLTTAYRP
jgi:hypothetical protein